MRRKIMAAAALGMLLLLNGCSALPSEERSFAVVLGVNRNQAIWQAFARVPTYQTNGGYATASGEGETLLSALAALDEALPMKLDLGQLRLLLISRELAAADDLPKVLAELTQRHDMRRQAVVCLTEETMDAVMEAMKPSAGTRLSKSLDVLTEAKMEQGIMLPSDLSTVMLMGERQQAILPALSMKDKEIDITGGYPINAAGQAGERMSSDEMKLVALMAGRLKTGTVNLPEGAVQVLGISADTALRLPDFTEGAVRLMIRRGDSDLPEEWLEQRFASACLAVLEKLSGIGCDALGMGRKAICRTQTMAQWDALNWPERYRSIAWRVSVGVSNPT